jgi:RNA polymerase sigma factor (sigma-70 family)
LGLPPSLPQTSQHVYSLIHGVLFHFRDDVGTAITAASGRMFMNNLTNEELAAIILDPGATKADKDRAVEILFERINPAVQLTVSRILRSYPAADQQNVVQGFWALLYHRALRYDPNRGSFRVYLLGCARNAALDARRSLRAMRERQVDPGEAIPEDLLALARAGPDDGSSVPVEVALEALLAFLPANERTIFRRRFLDRLPVDVIARRKGIRLGMAYRILRDAFDRLLAQCNKIKQAGASGPTDLREQVLAQASRLATRRQVLPIVAAASAGRDVVVHELTPVRGGVLLDRLRGTLIWEQAESDAWRVRVTFWSRRAREDGNREEDLRKYDRCWIMMEWFLSGARSGQVEMQVKLDAAGSLMTSVPAIVRIVDPSSINRVRLLPREWIV